MSTGPADVVRAIATYNVKFSPNLGDGLIAECLESTMAAMSSTLVLRSCDLAGRVAYGHAQRNRRLLLRGLEAAPPSLRGGVAALGLLWLIRTRLRAHYDAAATDASAVIIGGGNLFADHDLNFPMKIAAVAQAARQRRLPVFIHACGFSAGWSDAGRRLFREALAQGLDLRSVTVRDTASRDIWNAELAALTGIEAGVVPDPGLLASRVFPASTSPGRDAAHRVALGVMSATELNYHGSRRWTAPVLRRWYLALTHGLVSRGAQVTLFCNGNVDDREELHAVHAALAPVMPPAAVELARAANPRELCRVIAAADTVIAHRLHAIIPAYSYGKDVLALRWDRKIDAFMASVGLRECVFDAPLEEPSRIAEVALSGQACRPAPQRVERELDTAHAAVATLASRIAQAIGVPLDGTFPSPVPAGGSCARSA